MSLAVLASRALTGLEALPVRVEVHVGPGLPAFHIVGLADTGVRESRERVRSAIVSSGFEFPAGRITVNLAPADLPKESGRFDLPIALGVLLASGQVAVNRNVPDDLSHYVFAGELSLTGAVMSVSAPLAIALGVARTSPGQTLILPSQGADLAAHVPGVHVLSASSLRQVVEHFDGTKPLDMPAARRIDSDGRLMPCMSDVKGQAIARRALEVAAAGRHSLLMTGPPGTGKSMLAHRLPGLLPPLSTTQSLEVAAIAGLCGDPPCFSATAPFRAPHHSSSVAALVGGGAYPRPGEISRAHHGVIFLDELPEFQRGAIESLREPLETGQVAIARSARSAVFPASFQLVAAMNPCPCGWLGHRSKPCTCTPDRVQRYRAKVSGPFLDRVDLHVTLRAAGTEWLDLPSGEASSIIQTRVARCVERQLRRQGCMNAALDSARLAGFCQPDVAGARLLEQGIARWGWSGRAVHRILRVARTLADMADRHRVGIDQVAEAMQYRQGGSE